MPNDIELIGLVVGAPLVVGVVLSVLQMTFAKRMRR